MTQITETIKQMPEVERISEWNGRLYITLAAARGSKFNADLRSKIWIKGDALTIERGKGYHSDAYTAAKEAVIATVAAAGGTVREI